MLRKIDINNSYNKSEHNSLLIFNFFFLTNFTSLIVLKSGSYYRQVFS